jgi:hypothetical protein
MNAVLARLRRRLTFANVLSASALFVALGGTSYAAITLPDNSVGTSQIRTGGVGKSEVQTGAIGSAEIRSAAVGKSEIRTGGVGAAELHTDSVRAKEIKDGSVGTAEIAKDAVTADQIKDGSVGLAELDDATRGAISAGPFHAAVNKAGAAIGGNAKTVGKTATGTYNVDFGTDVSKCTAVATLAKVGTDTPDAGVVTVAPGTANTAVVVSTFSSGGATPTAADEPFDIVLGC